MIKISFSIERWRFCPSVVVYSFFLKKSFILFANKKEKKNLKKDKKNVFLVHTTTSLLCN